MNFVYQYQYKHRQCSLRSPVYNTSINGSNPSVHWTSTTILRRCKLGYLRVSSRIFKRNFYESAQINGVEQHSEQSSYVNSDWPSVELLKHFLLVALPYMNDMISISIHEELQNCLHLCIIKSFVSLKVLIQSERTRWFMV